VRDSNPSAIFNVDCDALARAAHPQLGALGPREALNRLWQSLLSLPQWEFPVHPQLQGGPRAFTTVVEGRHCVFAFTDAERAHRIAQAHALLADAGTRLRISMPLPGVLDWLRGAGQTGEFAFVQFNFGGDRWFVPVQQFDVIVEHLRLGAEA